MRQRATKRAAWSYAHGRLRPTPRDARARYGDDIVVTRRRNTVLYTIAVILLALWVLGSLTAFTAGGLLHLLLVAAVVIVLFQLITGRRAP